MAGKYDYMILSTGLRFGALPMKECQYSRMNQGYKT